MFAATWIRGVSALAGMALLGACGGSGSEDRAAAGDRALQVVGQFEVHSVDPSTGDGFFTRLQVAETLVDADPTGVLRPGLATEWEAAPDQLSWRFPLHPEARFHDGTDVTAENAAAALRIARGKAGTPMSDVPIKEIATDGDSTLIVHLDSPYAPLPAVLADTSAQILAPASYNEDGSVREVIGTGPYRVERLQIPQRIDVVAVDDWRGPSPAIARVSYLAVGRPETRALMAGSGEAAVTFGLDPTALQRLRGDQDLRIDGVTQPRTILLKLNNEHDLLSDARVRRALSLALDRTAMATALLRDPDMAATQLFPPSLRDWHHDDLEPLTHDQAAARDLLAEAGWEPGPDDVLVRDGEAFELTLLTYPDRPELPVLATAIQAALKEIGIALDVRVGNSSEIPAAHQDGSLELALFARNFSLVPDPLVTLLEDFAPEGAEWGVMGWEDDTLTSALTDLVDGADASATADGRRRVAEILQSELPVIPVAWYRQSAAVDARLGGLVLDPLERSWGLTALSWATE